MTWYFDKEKKVVDATFFFLKTLFKDTTITKLTCQTSIEISFILWTRFVSFDRHKKFRCFWLKSLYLFLLFSFWNLKCSFDNINFESELTNNSILNSFSPYVEDGVGSPPSFNDLENQHADISPSAGGNMGSVLDERLADRS